MIPRPYQTMKNTLPPGLYDAVIKNCTEVRGSGKNGLRMKLALANAIMMGTVMYEIRLHDDHIDTLHLPFIYKSPRSKRNRHYKAKAQPNHGPRGNNPW
jgi:hypothetical protein